MRRGGGLPGAGGGVHSRGTTRAVRWTLRDGVQSAEPGGRREGRLEPQTGLTDFVVTEDYDTLVWANRVMRLGHGTE